MVGENIGVGSLVAEFGFPVIMAVGMGYFIFYIWQFISDNIQPEIDTFLQKVAPIVRNRTTALK